jgi:hypothetical protein
MPQFVKLSTPEGAESFNLPPRDPSAFDCPLLILLRQWPYTPFNGGFAMRLLALPVLALAAVVAASSSGQDDKKEDKKEAKKEDKKEAKKTEVIPQAKPVVTWLEAVKDGDEKKLKTAFSDRSQKIFDKDWGKALKGFKDQFKAAFGDYKVDDFAFQFKGDDKLGKVAVNFKGKEFHVRVLKEKEDWKVELAQEVAKAKVDDKAKAKVDKDKAKDEKGKGKDDKDKGKDDKDKAKKDKDGG